MLRIRAIQRSFPLFSNTAQSKNRMTKLARNGQLGLFFSPMGSHGPSLSIEHTLVCSAFASRPVASFFLCWCTDTPFCSSLHSFFLSCGQ